MLDYDLIKNILIVGIAAGIITTSLSQRLKIYLSKSNHVPILCFFISMIIGTLFALSFTKINLIYALWVGLFTFIGADTLYQAFEGKFFKPFTELNPPEPIDPDDPIIIERSDEDEH